MHLCDKKSLVVVADKRLHVLEANNYAISAYLYVTKVSLRWSLF